MNQPQSMSPQRIASRADAAAAVAHLNEVMDALLMVVDQETTLVRGGRLQAVTQLEEAKTGLAKHYVADVTLLRANAPYLEKHEPKLLEALRQRHQNFHAQLQVNLTVLATAHAVAEGIVRGVSAELTQKTRPQVYGANGRSAVTPPRQSQPLTTSRVL